jgi:ribose transport system substrate-binding protein
MFVFDPFPPVQMRGVIADAIFGNFPDIEVLDRVTPDVQRRRDRRQPRARWRRSWPPTPSPARIAAVWAAWDQPALGALQAIEAAGRADEGIVITGIDANPQARDAIAQGGNFEASVAQDFEGIGRRRPTRSRASSRARITAARDLRADAAHHLANVNDDGRRIPAIGAASRGCPFFHEARGS